MTDHEKTWGTGHQGYMILLLDQSGSMIDPFGGMQVGSGKRKCDMVATVLNNFLGELIAINTLSKPDGTTEVRERADISILGYGEQGVDSEFDGNLKGKTLATLPELQQNPVDIEMREKTDIDDTGAQIKVPIPFPVWVRAKGKGGTPMCAALQRAHDLAAQWVQTHPDLYPPVIIHVTDGESTDGDPTAIARNIAQIRTSDGEALLYNVHITDKNLPAVEYPASEAELPNDPFARLLFSISSVIPERSRILLESTGGSGKKVSPGARGMIFNGDALSVSRMFTFATAVAQR